MAAALGTSSKLGYGATSTVSNFLEITGESIKLVRPILYNGAIIGTRSQVSERTREGPRSVSGGISCTPSPVELDGLLEYITGSAESTDVFALAETVGSFYIAVDRHVKVPVYSGCKVNTATFSASLQGFLQLDMDILGIDESVGAAGSFPAISLDVASKPYVMTDLAVVVNSVTVAVDQISISINHMLEAKYFNSLTATRINETGREVTWSLMVPYGDNVAAYGLDVAGVACTATFTNDNRSILFSSSKVQFVKESAVVNGRGELMLPLTGVARKNGSTMELVITNDSSS